MAEPRDQQPAAMRDHGRCPGEQSPGRHPLYSEEDRAGTETLGPPRGLAVVAVVDAGEDVAGGMPRGWWELPRVVDTHRTWLLLAADGTLS
jgi:hypothetical protein